MTTAQEKFQAFAPDAPLPWEEHPDIPGIVLDANGVLVCEVNLPHGGEIGAAAMIVVAVNTCGGFKAKIVPAAPAPTTDQGTGERVECPTGPIPGRPNDTYEAKAKRDAEHAAATAAAYYYRDYP